MINEINPQSNGGEDLVAHPSGQRPTANPFAQSANITLSIPETVEVKLVDASVLADYEIWILLTSILSSAVAGFVVAIVQAPANDQGRYIANAVIFALLMIGAAFMGYYKRKKLSSNARKIRFRVGDQLPDD